MISGPIFDVLAFRGTFLFNYYWEEGLQSGVPWTEKSACTAVPKGMVIEEQFPLKPENFYCNTGLCKTE